MILFRIGNIETSSNILYLLIKNRHKQLPCRQQTTDSILLIKNSVLKSFNKTFISSCSRKNFHRKYYITTTTETTNSIIQRKSQSIITMENSKFSTTSPTKLPQKNLKSSIKLSDYDYIGFDLDNTLVRYKLMAMVKLEYDIIAKFLVEQKGYSSRHLLEKSFESGIDFLQKGLIIDYIHGNILKVNRNGYILKASHGSRPLTDNEICLIYGSEKHWTLLSNEYCRDYLSTWNGPLSEKMRSLLDYFDMPTSLLYARIIDSLVEQGTDQDTNQLQQIYPHIYDALVFTFTREHFKDSLSPYFREMKEYPDKYIERSSEKLIKFLQDLKSIKTTFVLTGSHIDFANHTGGYALGKNWRNLFDTVVCFARKPGFFTQNRPFMNVIDDCDEIEFDKAIDKYQLNHTYSQGNFNELTDEILKLKHGRHTNTNNSKPKILYIGDNLIQDCYTPFKYLHCDTIAISEELFLYLNKDDYMTINPYLDDVLKINYPLYNSNRWQSFFGDKHSPTLWTHLIKTYSKLCIPSMDFLAHNPIDFEYPCFDNDSSECEKIENEDFNESNKNNNIENGSNNGFYPKIPTELL